MSDTAMSGDSDTDLVLAFARVAARNGWSRTTLDAFGMSYGVSPAECRRRWPKGVRSLAHEFNSHADAMTAAACLRRKPLSQIMIERFEANELFKISVRKLAISDLSHPIDTIFRTAATATLFWECQDRPMPRSTTMRTIKVCALVIVYSAAVLIWLWSNPSSYGRLHKLIRFSTLLLGAH